MKNIIKLMSVLVVGLLITGCTTEKTDKIKVVSTIFPYYDFTRAVAGDNAELTMLIDAGTDIHSYDPTPDDIIKISEADIFIYTGGHSDEWVNEIIDEIDTTKTKVIRVMNYLDVVVEEEIEGATEEHEEEEEGVEYDEHVWTSLSNASKIVNLVRDNLISIDSDNQALYTENALSYTDKINEIDEEITSIVETSTNKTLVFGDRFAFRYFTDQYGLKYSAAFPGCSSDTEPSVATITYLINKIEKENIPVILYLEMSTQKIADTLSSETNVPIKEMYSLQTISKTDFDNKETFVSIFERNIEVLEEALK